MSHTPPPDPNRPEFTTPEHADSDAGFDAVEHELGALEQQLAAANEEVLRTRAEMDNLRKRLMREMDAARRYAGERVLVELLPVADSLEQGLAAVTAPGPARDGLELTSKQLAAALEKQGVRAIDPLGQAFDPAEHQAISIQPSDSQPDNTVLTVLQKGYRLHERLLRPALVIVARAADGA